LSVARSMFRDLWDSRLCRVVADEKHLKQRLGEIDRQSDALLERIVDATNAAVITAYEKKIGTLYRGEAARGRKARDPRATIRTLRPDVRTSVGSPQTVETLAVRGALSQAAGPQTGLQCAARLDRKSGYSNAGFTIAIQALSRVLDPGL
jgi:hypothetical protein